MYLFLDVVVPGGGGGGETSQEKQKSPWGKGDGKEEKVPRVPHCPRKPSPRALQIGKPRQRALESFLGPPPQAASFHGPLCSSQTRLLTSVLLPVVPFTALSVRTIQQPPLSLHITSGGGALSHVNGPHPRRTRASPHWAWAPLEGGSWKGGGPRGTWSPAPYPVSG